MYEKENVLIAKWANYNVPWDDKLRQGLVDDLIGKPIVINVAGVKQKIGVVRQTRLGRDGIFADLVLETEEIAVAKLDELGKLVGFTAVKIKHSGESTDEFSVLKEKLKISEEKASTLEERALALDKALQEMTQKMKEEQIEAMENLKEAELTIRKKLQVAEEFIYRPSDFDEYNQELKLKGLPPSEPSAAQVEGAKKFERPLIAGEDLEPGDPIVIRDGKIWSAKQKPEKPASSPKPRPRRPKKN